MSTTRTNDKAQLKAALEAKLNAFEAKKKAIEESLDVYKSILATIYTKSFLQSKYSLYTEIMYLLHTPDNEGKDVDVKIGKTTFRAAIVRRTGSVRTYKKEYTFYTQGRAKDDPLRGITRKRLAPMPDNEYYELSKELEKKNKRVKSDKNKHKLEDYVEETHAEWKTLFLASGRLGDQEYDCFPILEGWFAFPFKYDEKTNTYLDAIYWEKEVQKVLAPWRNAHRVKKTKSRGIDLTSDPDLMKPSGPVMVSIQNTSDDSERCILTADDYLEYVKLYMKTCLELGGIPINFTKDYKRHQIADDLNNTPDYYDDFAAEQTICHWEGIKKQIEKEEAEQHKREAPVELELPDVLETGEYIELPSDFPFDLDSSFDSDLELED